MNPNKQFRLALAVYLSFSVKRKHEFLVEGERALVLSPLTPYRQLKPSEADPRALAQNRLTALHSDVLAQLLRRMDDATLQQCARFLFAAYAVHPKMCFAHYSPNQHALLALLRGELTQRPVVVVCERALTSRLLLANAPRNFPARIQPEEATRATEQAVRSNAFAALFVFVNCQLE